MKEEQDYIRDIAEIRSMMERSSKFLSLSGWAGVMAGIYALSGAFVADRFFHFNPAETAYSSGGAGELSPALLKLIFLAMLILILAVGTAILLSYKKAAKRGEKLWNATARRLLTDMAVPLVIGGLLVLILIAKGLIGLLAPCTLIFYGLALFNASRFSYHELKFLGLIQIGLGLLGACLPGCGLVFWAAGFGLLHIIYGMYIHYRYER